MATKCYVWLANQLLSELCSKSSVIPVYVWSKQLHNGFNNHPQQTKSYNPKLIINQPSSFNLINHIPICFIV